MAKVRFEEIEKKHRGIIETITKEKDELLKQHKESMKEKSTLQEEKENIEETFLKLLIAFIQIQTIGVLYKKIFEHTKLLFFYQLWDIENKYKSAPSTYERYDKLDAIGDALSEVLSNYEETINFDSIYEIRAPEETEKYVAKYKELGENLDDFWTSINPFIHQYVTEQENEMGDYK